VLPIRATVPLLSTPEQGVARVLGSERPAPLRRLDGVRVLVVDDEVDARDLLQLVLGEAGAIVQTAGTATAAFARLQSHAPHVIVSDIGMPDEDGYALMRRIREAEAGTARVPAIALTAYTRQEDRARALAMGFSAHLGKPVSATELLDLVAVLAKAPA
jgi:CheY-like chemotaxis protein